MGRGIRALLALAVLNAIAPLAPVASAQESGDSSTLEVVAGHGGLFARGRSVPVRVTVRADRLLSGELRASDTGSGTSVEVPVEVPGGSVKRFLLVLPPGSLGVGDRVAVELRSRGRVIARQGTTASSPDAELVGLSPGVLSGRSLPGPARLAVDVGIARFSLLELGDLASGPGAIDSLGTVGMRSEELARLGRQSRSALLAWVSQGGHLLVADDQELGGGALASLPAEWQPGPSGRTRAGRGEVRLAGEAMRSGSFDGLVEPTSRGSRSSREVGTTQTGSAIADTVAGDAGLALPKITWLLAFLGVYVLAVGPGTALVLRRRRRPELAWVVVPVVAVVFTAAAYVGSGDTRSRTRIAHASLVELDGAGPIASSWVGLSRPGGSARVRFGKGWEVIPAPVLFGGRLSGGRLSGGRHVRIVGGEPEAELELDVAQFGLLAATGPISLPGGLFIEASVDGDSVSGVVRNQLPFAIEEAVVLLDGRLTAIGKRPLGRSEPGVSTPSGRRSPQWPPATSRCSWRTGSPVTDSQCAGSRRRRGNSRAWTKPAAGTGW